VRTSISTNNKTIMATAAGGAAAGWVATTYASPALRAIVEGKSAAALRAAGKDYYSSARSDVGVDGVAILPASAAVFVQFAGASYVGALAVLKASAAVIQQDASGHGELVSIEAQQIVCLLSAAQCELSLSERCATMSKDLAAACERGEARSSLPKPLPNDLAERRALLKECAKRCTESLRLDVKAAKRAQFMAKRAYKPDLALLTCINAKTALLDAQVRARESMQVLTGAVKRTLAQHTTLCRFVPANSTPLA
jgi:hypothetical protein